uniref:hypothetical protein n=1 Tax=Eubacterium cellulosolvens TaxID=29322 RepID=UPI0012DE7E47|nr:hypothetical protein [[Eubacterium] cellulosolvens]
MEEKLNSRENGAIMVEATIYIPIVLCMVVALIYLALFNMQEYMIMYEAERVASVVARDVAYNGYDHFKMGEGNEIDFQEFPSSEAIKEYYESYHTGVSSLYREVGNLFAAVGVGGTDESSYEHRFANAAAEYSLIAAGTISAPDVEVDDGLLGTSVTVTFTHTIPVPGVLKYLGYKGTTNLRVAAYSYSVNPGEFARNVDLASDLVDYVFKKLNISGFPDFKSKVSNVLDKIL